MTPLHQPIVYIISAPSGSGKSTLVGELLKSVADLDFSISYTTRHPRGSERNGKQYHFVTCEEFQRMIEADEFLEHAQFDGNYYGTARRYLKSAVQKGRDLLLDIDVQGAAQIQRQVPEAVSIFVLPPDKKTLEWRLRHRSEDPEEDIKRRLDTATREIENYDRYNYILVNDQLEKSVEGLESITRSERLLRSGRVLTEPEQQLVETANHFRLANVKDRVQPILASFREPPPSA